MSRILTIASLLAGLGAAACAEQVQGVLLDKQCSSKAEVRMVPGPRLEGGMIVAESHTRECALMPECQKSGYGVFTYDNKFLAFDENGNRLALAAIKASKKIDDLQVEVTGQVNGNIIKVASLKLQQ
jgi:hypothetical protein